MSDLTLDQFQQAALRTLNAKLDGRERLLDAAMGLSEEAGEVLGLVRKRALAGRDVSDDRLREELGDALWCLAVTAHALGMSLSDVARANQAKLDARHPGGGAGA
ncbi:MAG: nucleotide pyrophosphohydrolase [Gemmatimonadetes bacterium]|nr:nucleotide pyrophosphohydrolase [Gemmatimonadota bacterium]